MRQGHRRNRKRRGDALSRSRAGRRLASLLLWAAGLVLVANLVAELTGLYVWQPFTHPFETARIAEAWSSFPDSEVLLLGSSLVQNGLSPGVMMARFERDLGRPVPVYNLAIFGGGAGGMASFLRAAARGVRPRLVVYGTTQQECRFAQGLDRMRFYRTFASPIDVLAGHGARGISLQEWRLRMSAAFKPLAVPGQAAYQILAQTAARTMGLPRTRFEDERLRLREGRGWNSIGRGDIPGSWKYREVAIDWASLARIHQVVAGLGAELVVLHMPEDLSAVPGNAEVREIFARQLKEFCERRSIPYFDLNEVDFSPQSEEFAADGRHLLASGARRLSRELARDILAPLLYEPSRADLEATP